MAASAVEAMAMEAWAVALAPATALASAGWAVALAVATAMAPALSVAVAMDADLALALAATIEDAMEDSHSPIHQFWTPKVLCLTLRWCSLYTGTSDMIC